MVTISNNEKVPKVDEQEAIRNKVTVLISAESSNF